MSDPSAPDPLLLTTAIEAVLEAGRIQLASFGRAGVRVEKKGVIDLVTEVDLEVETGFRAFIAERFPTHGILAEELQATAGAGGVAVDGGPQHVWIFDPLDGTTNYAHGLPIFCASLALEIDGVLAVAAIYDPVRQELFTAERGGGAYMNGRRLAVSRTGELIDALLVTGFHYDVHHSGDEVLDLFAGFVRRAQAVRRLGSAALDLCYVAAGRLDGYWEQRLKPWDVAAGALIVAEAGGLVTGMDGTPFAARTGHLVASNGRVHGAMVGVIEDVRRARA